MITLNTQICDTLDLTYWQLKGEENDSQQEVLSIKREEKELLRKILLAKNIKLTDEILSLQKDSVAIINLGSLQLIFDDVNLTDSNNIVHLASLSDMINDPEQKKSTWFKLKNLDLQSR